jgi:hypothetical protein
MGIESSFQIDPEDPLHFVVFQGSRTWEFEAENTTDLAAWKKHLFVFRDGKRIEVLFCGNLTSGKSR